jgi:SAM-dependent methyltransferase
MRSTPFEFNELARRFRRAYGRQRAMEGRSTSTDELLALPYVKHGPLAQQWGVRARSFDRFVALILAGRAAEVAPRPLRVADLGAGNAWLCYRLALLGHSGLAVDVRTDTVDGLGAAGPYVQRVPAVLARIAASFEAIPLESRSCDLAVFNASLHYALDLKVTLAEAGRIVEPGGRLAILDSPFYQSDVDGNAMVMEKRRNAAQSFGARAADLMALPFIEFLTVARLAEASTPLGLVWRRHRVRYPLWYEARPFVAKLRRRRPPSRFDIWEAVVP